MDKGVSVDDKFQDKYHENKSRYNYTTW